MTQELEQELELEQSKFQETMQAAAERNGLQPRLVPLETPGGTRLLIGYRKDWLIIESWPWGEYGARSTKAYFYTQDKVLLPLTQRNTRKVLSSWAEAFKRSGL